MKYINKRLNWTAEESFGGMSRQRFFQVTMRDGTYFKVPAELIIDSPDWQLKPSYEITAFRLIRTGELMKLKDNGLYSYDKHDCFTKLDVMLNDDRYYYSVKTGHFDIFSVLREDGIEFSLQQKTEQGEIEKFIINSENEMVVRTRLGQYYFHELTPAKKVILTTFDGVDVTDLETMLWGVYDFEMDKRPYEAATFKNEFAAKTFSTREAAEDYINKNKPNYSENQIREAYDALFGDFTVTDFIHKLNEKI